jgi:hypothetical protein
MTGSDPVAAARDLEQAAWHDAIALLESAYRQGRRDEIEIELAALRYRSFGALTRSASPSQELAPGQPPPVGERGLPEVSIDELSAATARAAVIEHGCLLVKNAVDRERASRLAAEIDHAFAAQEEETGEQPTSSWFVPLALEPREAASLGRKWVRGGGGVLMADSPRLMAEVLDLYAALGLRDVVSGYLGSRPVLSANKCTLRRVSVTSSGDWHQDGAFLGAGIRAINLWLTLTTCGIDAPGLDLVPRRLEGVVETGTGGAHFDWAVGPDVVDAVAGSDGVLRPRFDAGDLLVFDDLFLHRTAIESDMTRDRYAIEMWSFAWDQYPAGQVPLVW